MGGGGRGVKLIKPSMGEGWIFSGTTQYLQMVAISEHKTTINRPRGLRKN